MRYGEGLYGKGTYGELEQATNTLDQSELFPPGAKAEIKDYLNQTFGDTWNFITELASILPPPKLTEWWALFIELIKAIP